MLTQTSLLGQEECRCGTLIVLGCLSLIRGDNSDAQTVLQSMEDIQTVSQISDRQLEGVVLSHQITGDQSYPRSWTEILNCSPLQLDLGFLIEEGSEEVTDLDHVRSISVNWPMQSRGFQKLNWRMGHSPWDIRSFPCRKRRTLLVSSPISIIVAMNNRSIILDLLVGGIGYGRSTTRLVKSLVDHGCSGQSHCLWPRGLYHVSRQQHWTAGGSRTKCSPHRHTGVMLASVRRDRKPYLDMSDPRSINYVQQLKQRPETEFLYYNPESGSRTFKVQHFSSYSTGEGWKGVAFAPRCQLRPASSAPNTSSSSSSSSQIVRKLRETLESRFAPIWERFCVNTLTIQDKNFLETTLVNLDDYDHYSSIYKFRRGVELMNSRIVLFEVALRPHECVAETIDHLVGRTWDIFSLGSAGMIPWR